VAARSSTVEVTAEMNRCFEEVGALVVKGDGLTTAHSRFPRLQPEMFTDQSLTAVLSSVQSVLSNARMESDRSAEEKSRVCGSLYAMAMSFAAAESIPQVWIDTGGWNALARLMKDENMGRTATELMLTAVASRLDLSSQVHLSAVMEAGFSSCCVSSLSRFRDHPRIRLSATTLLGSLCCNADAASLRRLISDGAVLALVQLLQQPCDDHDVTPKVRLALQQVATLPEGRAALHHRDVRRAFNVAFQQPENSTSLRCYCGDAQKIALLLYGGSGNDDLLLTHEVTVLIHACLNSIRTVWKDDSADQAAVSARILADLCFINSFSDKAVSLDAVAICLDAVRACQPLRADYWLQDGFTGVLHALFALGWNDTAGGKAARTRFIHLDGMRLLMEVLGDGSAAARPSVVVYKVCLMLFSLARATDSVHAVSALSAAAKDVIRQSLSAHAAFLNSRDWWVKQKGSETLLRVLAK